MLQTDTSTGCEPNSLPSVEGEGEVNFYPPLTPQGEIKVKTEVKLDPADAPLSRSEVARRLEVSPASITKTLKAISEIHSLEGFEMPRGKRLTALAIARILEYRELGCDGYSDKYGSIPETDSASVENGKLTVLGDAPLQTWDDRSFALGEGRAELDRQNSALSNMANANRKATDNQLDALKQNRQGFVASILGNYRDMADAISAQGQRVFTERLAENEAEFYQELAGINGSTVPEKKSSEDGKMLP